MRNFKKYAPIVGSQSHQVSIGKLLVRTTKTNPYVEVDGRISRHEVSGVEAQNFHATTPIDNFVEQIAAGNIREIVEPVGNWEGDDGYEPQRAIAINTAIRAECVRLMRESNADDEQEHTAPEHPMSIDDVIEATEETENDNA